MTVDIRQALRGLPSSSVIVRRVVKNTVHDQKLNMFNLFGGSRSNRSV